MTELDKAIADVLQAADPGDWTANDFFPVIAMPRGASIATILNAVASGELIPKADPGDDAGLVADLRYYARILRVPPGGFPTVANGLDSAADRIEALIAERDVLASAGNAVQETSGMWRDRALAAEQNARLAVAEAIRRAGELAEEWARETFEGDPVKVSDYIADALADTDAMKAVEGMLAELAEGDGNLKHALHQLDQAKAEVEALRARAELARWNIDEDGSLIRLCRGDHDRGEDCGLHEERFVPAARAEALAARVQELEGGPTLESSAEVVLKYITNPDWADRNSETFRTMPWQALYDEMRKDRDDFPALARTFLEAFTDAEFRAALAKKEAKE